MSEKKVVYFKDLNLSKSFPGKIVTLYIAKYPNYGEDMEIDSSMDDFFISKEAALNNLLKDIDVSTLMNDVSWREKPVSFITIELNKKKLNSQPLLSEAGLIYPPNPVDSFTMSLKDKDYKINVEDSRILDIAIEVDPETQIRRIKNVTFIDE